MTLFLSSVSPAINLRGYFNLPHRAVVRVNRIGIYKGFPIMPGTYYVLDELIVVIVFPVRLL